MVAIIMTTVITDMLGGAVETQSRAHACDKGHSEGRLLRK